ncbi:MAG: tetratricopeptide repeat protein [Bacteroides sp.]|nr:tetratricopeptide repeat protein [Bacteroides sp.]MCM1379659.1 tetratricopeptide repeat protein [Bacteroides sp.]MCM1445959.1 tetratricopeptide repeat protein [Prevotella sp.]
MKRLLFILLAALTLSAAADYDADLRQRLADYYFLEGMRQRAIGDESLSTALMQRALDISGDRTSRQAFEVGSRLMMFGQSNGDSLQLSRGIALCESYFGAHPDDIYAGSYIASYHADSGNLDRAIEIYEILEKAKPDNTALLGGHADLLMRQHRIDDATAIYRRLERTLGRNTALTQRLVSGLVFQGDTVGALAEIDDLIAAQPRSVEALHLGAYISTMLNRPEQGLGYVERAQVLDPSNGATYYHAASIYKLLGRDDDYETAIRGAIEGDDLELDAKIELLRYFIGEEMLPDGTGADKIAPLFESLVSQYTHDADLRRLYASFLITEKRYSEAAEQMEQVIALSPSTPADFDLLVRLYGSAGRTDSMIDATRMAITAFPKEVGFYELQAGAYSRNEQPELAIETLRSALAIDSLTAQTRSTLFRDIADMAQVSKAVSADSIRAYYEQALTLDPENDLAMNNYAYWLSETPGGDLLRAKDLIAKAIIFDPGSATYYDTYAWVCFKLGDLENAKRYIDMALLFDKSEQEDSPEQLAELLNHGAEIYERLGQLDKANEYRTRANQLTQKSKQ